VSKKFWLRPTAQKGIFVALAAGFATVLATAGAQTLRVATQTTLTTNTQEVGGHEVTTYSATVVSTDGAPATGVVTLAETGRTLASAALDATGKAEIRVDGLAAGNHTLLAVYGGDSAHAGSQSESVIAHAAPSADSFALSIAPTSISVASPGQSANVVATITSGSTFTGFLSLSCAGAPVSTGSSTDGSLPVGVTCTFTPANLQVTTAGSTVT